MEAVRFVLTHEEHSLISSGVRDLAKADQSNELAVDSGLVA